MIHKFSMNTRLLIHLDTLKNVTVLRWEALENFPDLYQLKELADILHCSIDWILYNEPFLLHEKQYMDDLYDLAQAVLLWKTATNTLWGAGLRTRSV